MTKSLVVSDQRITADRQNNSDLKSKSYIYANFIDSCRNNIYAHISITVILTFFNTLFGSAVESFGIQTTYLFSLIFSVMFAIYLFKVIFSWDSAIKNGLIEFWDICINLAMKNYRICKEYREIRQYSSAKNNDEGHMKNINGVVEKINQYIRLSYYLSFLCPTDCLDLKQGVVYVNIRSESILNKRNRKLEVIVNSLPIECKNELFKTWVSTDRNRSDRFLVILPYKWIIYEYRTIFRYLNHLKQQINQMDGNYFDSDRREIEQMCNKMCVLLQNMFRRSTVYLPKPFITMFNIISDILVIMMDNQLAVTVAYYLAQSSAFLIPILFGCVFHLIAVSAIHTLTNLIGEIENPLKEHTDLDHIDQKIETIFQEMKAIAIDGTEQMVQ
jgi:hypothetical protein